MLRFVYHKVMPGLVSARQARELGQAACPVRHEPGRPAHQPCCNRAGALHALRPRLTLHRCACLRCKCRRLDAQACQAVAWSEQAMHTAPQILGLWGSTVYTQASRYPAETVLCAGLSMPW